MQKEIDRILSELTLGTPPRTGNISFYLHSVLFPKQAEDGLNPSKDETDVAKYLRFNLPTKKATLFGEQAVYFSGIEFTKLDLSCLLYTSPSPRDGLLSRMPSSA